MHELAKQVVVAKPLAAPVERHEEQVGLLKRLQPLSRAHRPDDPVAQLGRESCQYRRLHQKRPDIRRQSLQDLARQIVGNVAVAGRELAQLLVGRVRPAKPHARKRYGRRPALSVLHQYLDILAVKAGDAATLQKRFCLLDREGQILGAHLSEDAATPERVEPDGRIGARGCDHPGGGRQPLHRILKQRQPILVGHMVEIVENDHDLPRVACQPDEELVDRFRDRRVWRSQLRQRRSCDSRTQAINGDGHRRPQLACRGISALHGHPRDRQVRSPAEPGGDCNRLSRPRRRAHQQQPCPFEPLKHGPHARPVKDTDSHARLRSHRSDRAPYPEMIVVRGHRSPRTIADPVAIPSWDSSLRARARIT